MKIHAKVVILLLVFSTFSLSGQNKYNIDAKPLDERKMAFSEFIKKSKSNRKGIRELRQKHRFLKRSSKKTKKLTYKNQTKAVRKQMKKQEDKAFHFNHGTIPFKTKLKRIFSWMILVK